MWFKKIFIKKYCLRPEISLLRVGQNPKKSTNFEIDKEKIIKNLPKNVHKISTKSEKIRKSCKLCEFFLEAHKESNKTV